MRLRGGSVAARLRNPQSLGEFEMVTDEGRFRVQAVGRYRFDRFDQTSDVTAFNGQAIYEARNTGAAGDHRPARAVLDRHRRRAAVRDRGAGARRVRGLERRSRSRRGSHVTASTTRYVSSEMTGYEDLDSYWLRG